MVIWASGDDTQWSWQWKCRSGIEREDRLEAHAKESLTGNAEGEERAGRKEKKKTVTEILKNWVKKVKGESTSGEV